MRRLSASCQKGRRKCSGFFWKGINIVILPTGFFLSLATIKSHVNHIYRKLDISRKEELFLKIKDATPKDQ